MSEQAVLPRTEPYNSVRSTLADFTNPDFFQMSDSVAVCTTLAKLVVVCHFLDLWGSHLPTQDLT